VSIHKRYLSAPDGVFALFQSPQQGPGPCQRRQNRSVPAPPEAVAHTCQEPSPPWRGYHLWLDRLTNQVFEHHTVGGLMAKAQDTKKDAKKKPTKTLKEKRKDKQEKKKDK
jgi:hypothetical protein